MAGITSKITSIDPDDNAIDLVDRLEEPKGTQSVSMTEPSGFGWIRIVTVLALIIWFGIAAILSFSVLKLGQNMQTYSALDWLGIVGLFLGPALMIGVAAYALKQLANLSGQAVQLARVAEKMTTPDQAVIGKSEVMAAAISKHVDSVNEKLNAALGRLASLEGVLQTHTGTMTKANDEAAQTAGQITDAIERQTSALDTISGTFDTSMGALSQSITDHTEKLAAAARMAEQKIKEARISVEGATAKINSASDIVRANTVQAASTLSGSHEDIKSLGEIIGQRSEELDQVYKKHANDLTAMIEQLRDEQLNLGAVLEDRLVKMRDISLSAQASAESLLGASKAGKDTVEALAESASLADSAVKARFGEMRDMVRYSTEHAQSIGDKAARRVQDSLELTRKEIARIERDMADLQTRLETPTEALELVEEDNREDDTPDNQNAIPKRWTRLSLKPVEDEKVEETPEQKDPEPEDLPPLDLYIEPEDHTDIFAPDDIRQKPEEPEFDPDTIRRAAPLEDTKKEKTKSGFSLRGLFGGSESKDEGGALDIVPPPQDNKPEVIKDLYDLGLSPHAIVDDGCIIEALNCRVAKGHDDMSRVVGERLKGPVEHLAKALSIDKALSARAIAFASQYDQTVEALTGNREAIRTRLENEKGRAYLLYDAALNYGRV